MYSGPLSLFPTFSAWRRPITGSLSMRHVAINVGDVHGPLHGVPGVHTNVPIYSISIGPTPLCRRCPWAVYVSLGPSGSLWLGRPPAAFPPTIRVTGCRPQRYLSSINKRITKGIYTDLYGPYCHLYYDIYHLRVSTHTDTLGALRFSFSGESYIRSARHLILSHQN